MRCAKSLARNWVLPFVDPSRLASVIRLPRFFVDWYRFRRRCPGSAQFVDLRPCLSDQISHTPFDPHYFYQAAWAARHLAEAKPSLHIDVGSSIAMISVLSAYVPLIFVDYRPLQAKLFGLSAVAGNITSLPFADASIQSLSSLHVIEHIGLGRYGDPIDPCGSFAALCELERVLARGARLYLSTPIGRERVCFNAHRVFSPRTILNKLQSLRLVSFAFVDDAGNFENSLDFAKTDSFSYGCGMFVFTKY